MRGRRQVTPPPPPRDPPRADLDVPAADRAAADPVADRAADPVADPVSPPGAPGGDPPPVLAALVGVLLVGITPNPPVTWLDWVQMLGGATLTAAVTTAAISERVRGVGGRFGSWLTNRSGRGWVWLFATPLVTVVVALVVPLLLDVARGLSYRVSGCPPATQVRLLAEPETIATARELAARYGSWTAEDNHGCPTAEVYAYAAEPATIARKVGTATGWSDATESLRGVGPRPDVWLASTRREVDAAAVGASAVVESVPVAHSPLVLAVPAGAPRPTGTWPETFRQLTDADVPVVRPAPRSTQVGLLATVLLYGRDPAAVDAPDPVAVERSLDAARGTSPITEGAAELLCPRRATAGTGSPAAATAVVATEQDVARYNQGAALGAACGPIPDPLPEDHRLTALYPVDTADQDLQLVRLRWNDPAPVQERAAEAFQRWLRSDPGRSALVSSGLRPAEVAPVPSAPLTAGYGVDPSLAASSEPLDAERWTEASDRFEATQLPSRLLFLVDTSGSMRETVSGRTRAEVVAGAVGAGLESLRPRDEFGLGFFPGGTAAGRPDAVPVRLRDAAQLAAAWDALGRVEPEGGTPLFRAVIDGVSLLTAGDGAEPDDRTGTRALVVLTDGVDTTSGIAPGEAAREVAGRGVRVVVVALGDVRCADAGLAGLAGRTGGQCVESDPAALSEQVQEIVSQLRGGLS